MTARKFKVQVFVHRIPITRPVRTSFGTMSDRPSVFVRVEDPDGYAGWGEVWCNYPSVGAEHRARLLMATVLPLAAELKLLDRPDILWTTLSERLSVLSIQTGEVGPIAQTISGLDCAVQDLAARRTGQPLWRHLGPAGSPRVPVYASGINPDRAAETARDAIAVGYAGAKLKIGFDPGLDRENLLGARALIGPGVPLMADVNQGWNLTQAMNFAPVCDDAGLAWLEEPLRHDAADADWTALAARVSTTLAAGENFSSFADFKELPGRRNLKVLQPDVGKWGGAIMSLSIGRLSAEHDLDFCPHWLGSGVGLMTALHVKAASRTEGGYVEVDFNPNPMREAILEAVVVSRERGVFTLSDAPGIGDIGPVVAMFNDACVMREECSF